MCKYIYIYIYILFFFLLYIYIYVYILLLLSYIYIYIYISYHSAEAREPDRRAHREGLGEGHMGSALMGSPQMLCFSTEGPFGYQSIKVC